MQDPITFDDYCAYDLSTYNYDYKNNILSIDVKCEVFNDEDLKNSPKYRGSYIFFIILALQYDLTTNDLKSKFKGFIDEKHSRIWDLDRTYSYYYDDDIKKAVSAKPFIKKYIKYYNDEKEIKEGLKLIKDYMDRKIHTLNELQKFNY